MEIKVKKSIHPKSKLVKIVFSKHESVELEMAIPAVEYFATQDPTEHQAWIKSNRNIGSSGKAGEFAKKHKGIEEIG